LEKFKIYIEIHTNITSRCFGLHHHGACTEPG